MSEDWEMVCAALAGVAVGVGLAVVLYFVFGGGED